MKGLIVWGTTSDAGKSYLVTGICRALSNRGYDIAPFKGQNMSNNSYVTVSGHEIGRSQGLQAEACRLVPTVHMNPVLLKPRSDQKAEVIIHGKSIGSPAAGEYRSTFFEQASEAVFESLDKLSDNYEFIIMEGAGSPAEINLMDKDLANLVTASYADVPALLAADIERGGVFASITGTMNLLPNEHRERVKGLVVNRFRGDPSLFSDGAVWIENKTGVPVNGVMPKLNLRIEQEDSLSFPTLQNFRADAEIDIAVIAMPYVSNYTDVEPFQSETDCTIRIVKDKRQFGRPDALLLPGTRSTINDLRFLRESGLDKEIIAHVQRGGFVAGICGGFQMLGDQLNDEEGNDSGRPGSIVNGLQLLPVNTKFEKHKITRRWSGTFQMESSQQLFVSGFEIHEGTAESCYSAEWKPLFISQGKPEGLCSLNFRIIGTYIHHIFHNDGWRTWWLNQVRRSKKIADQPVIPFGILKDEILDELAEQIEKHLNVEEIINIMKKEGRAG
ncbi:cobyric acid synthase [Alteribacillus sp. HJP-4]|uniref:cobyric acid synthase n=1 Tax=Alteribacillus sp. HJP-4 TaxID=2775394 RepID=UPI0035CD2887